MAQRFLTPAMAVTWCPIGCSNTSARFEAGSVVTMRVLTPISASCTAVAQAMVVLPTPPFPEKNRYRLAMMSLRYTVLVAPPSIHACRSANVG